MSARAPAVLAVLLALVAGCGGEEEQGAPTQPAAAGQQQPAPLLSEASFTDVVANAVRRETGLEAEPGSGLKVRVEDGPNWVELALDGSYARYRSDPESRDEIVEGVVSEAQRRLAQGIELESFEEVREYLMPLLKPRFWVRRLSRQPAQKPFARDLLVVYAVQRKTDFTIVTPADLARWGLGVDEIDPIAQENLVGKTEPLLCEPAEEGKLCGWANGDGYDATRMISAKLRADIVREIGPAAYAVPIESVFVAVPIKFARRIAPKVLEQFTTAEQPVSPEVFVEREGKLVPIDS